MKRRIPRECDRPIVDLATHESASVTLKVLATYKHVQCDVRTLRRMIDAGALVGYRVGREWRVTTASARRAFPVQQHEIAS